jgi:hypothetical protein
LVGFTSIGGICHELLRPHPNARETVRAQTPVL